MAYKKIAIVILLFLPILLLSASCVSASGKMTDGRGYIEGRITVPLGGSAKNEQSPQNKDEPIVESDLQ